MAFHEKWFAAPKQRKLAECLALVPPGPGELVEVGSWEGRSSILIAKTFPYSRLHVIDHWLGDLTNLPNGVAAIAQERDVFADFLANVTEAGVRDQIVVHRADWREVFKTWNAPIRMIFIDGQHTYDEVADNIDAAKPFLVPGALVCGDDITVSEVWRAVRDRFGSDFTNGFGPGGAIWWHVG